MATSDAGSTDVKVVQILVNAWLLMEHNGSICIGMVHVCPYDFWVIHTVLDGQEW